MLDQKNDELWSTNKKIIDADVDLLNSTMRILRVLMHFSLGHVILLGYFDPPAQTFHPIGLTAPGGLTLGFVPYFFFFSLRSFKVIDFDVNRKERIILPIVLVINRNLRFFRFF